jgi:UDP-N-acetylglucosamine acyltransferase
VPDVHPTAIIDPAAELADDVVVGAYALVEGRVKVGPGCVVRPHAHLIGPLTLGANNDVGRGTILGERPQHLAIGGDGADVVIGDGNTFREYCSVHRGAGPGKVTRVGNNNYFMAGAHIAHDCTIGNKCILANNALVGGHAVIGDSAFLSGNTGVHQRMRVGRCAMLGGCSVTTRDLPPFTICQNVNLIHGVNVVGMRRAGFAPAEIDGVRRAFRMLYLQGDLLPVALAKIERQLGHLPAVDEFIRFVRTSPNGICSVTGRAARKAA